AFSYSCSSGRRKISPESRCLLRVSQRGTCSLILIIRAESKRKGDGQKSLRETLSSLSSSCLSESHGYGPPCRVRRLSNDEGDSGPVHPADDHKPTLLQCTLRISGLVQRLQRISHLDSGCLS